MPIDSKKRKAIEDDLIKKRSLIKERSAIRSEIQRVKKLARDEVNRLEGLEAKCQSDIKTLTIVGISVKHNVAKSTVENINNSPILGRPYIDLSDYLNKQARL